MKLTLNKFFSLTEDNQWKDKNYTLSDFFPPNTFYFYGYPTGNESNFLNSVPPHIEELVASRAVVCSGKHVTPVVFNSTTSSKLEPSLLQELKITENTASLRIPDYISADVTGTERNNKLKSFLTISFKEPLLIMAQPFTDSSFANICQIKPEITNWLNDKANLAKIIPKKFLPKRYLLAKNGIELNKHAENIIAPCVIKVTSSSAGDGVYICKNFEDVNRTLKSLKTFNENIAVDEYVPATENYGVQFGISYDGKKIKLIGISKQITSHKGEFIGGIALSEIPKELDEIVKVILRNVCPLVYAKGWYGVGCLDVLVDSNKNSFVIDPNFRMTGMTAALMTRKKKHESVSFIMSYQGDEYAFINALRPMIEDGVAKIIAINRFNDVWYINIVIYYKNNSQMNNRITYLYNNDFQSELIESQLNLV